MKKILNLALVTMLTLGVVSCSNDDIDNGINPENQTNGKLTFVLPYASGVTTYAQEVSASDAEKEIVLANTSVYMFNASDELEAILAPASGATVGGKATATIDIDDAWTGGKTFIMVANNTSASTLPATVPSSPAMTKDDFMDLITDSQGTDQLACPLLMAGIEGVTDIQTESSVTMQLFRSVARFDILNNVATNKVTIKNVYVTNANLQGYVMGYERSSLEANTSVEIATGIATGDLDEVAVAAPIADVQDKEGAFYLYPAVVDANATKTVITLEVEEQGGATAFYTVHKFNAAGDTKEDLTIEANKRYIISSKINPVTGKLMFILAPADWDEGSNVIGTPGTGSTFGVITPQAADITNGTFNADLNSISVTAPASAFSADLAVMGTSTKGVTAEVIGTTGAGLIEVGSDIIKVTTPVTDGTITYAAPYFTYTFTISFEADKIAADKNFTTIVRLTDVATGASKDVIIYYGSTIMNEDGEVLYPAESGYISAVQVGTIYWAPLNVGATNTDATVLNQASTGYSYQWGRNEAFGYVANGESLTVASGPIDYVNINDYTGKFITGSTSTFLGWLNNDDPSWTTHRDMWSSAVNDSPCPDGWRLPMKSEVEYLASIFEAQGKPVNKTMNRVQIKGNDTTKYLYIPLAGNIIRETGVATTQGVVAELWTGEHSDAETEFHTHAYRITFTSSAVGIGNGARTVGASVRCVKNVQP